MYVNHENGNSKGYAFFEFTNYKEFSDALKLKGIIFGKQTLVLNSAKNKYEHNDEDKINELSNMHYNNPDDIKSLNTSMSNLTIPLSTAETGLSSHRALIIIILEYLVILFSVRKQMIILKKMKFIMKLNYK